MVSGKALAWLREQHPRTRSGKLDPDAKLVLFALADMDNARDWEHRVWPSQETLRQRTSLAISTIGKKLKLLEDQGYITRKRRQHSSGPRKGQRTSDLIILNLSKPADPDVDSGEQPAALRAANARRTQKVLDESIPHGQPALQRQQSGEAEGIEDIFIQEEAEFIEDLPSGEMSPPEAGHLPTVARSRDLDTPADKWRSICSRSPIHTWNERAVFSAIREFICEINPGARQCQSLLERNYFAANRRQNFDPALEVAAVKSLVANEKFIDGLKRDERVSAHQIISVISDQYRQVA